MSDARLRELERRWKETGNPQDGATYYRGRVRAGTLTENQIYTAAYLGDESAQSWAEGLYDQTGVMNDHICGICPCGWCRWDEGPSRWLRGLLDWTQNLPFPGIDDKHAEQEAMIRIGCALANGVWECLGQPTDPAAGAYVAASLSAERFLESPTEENRNLCRVHWQDENWVAPEWAHQVLYYIVSPGGWRRNLYEWFVRSARLLGPPCESCEARQTQVDHFAINTCEACGRHRDEWKDHVVARDLVSTALLPWVLKSPESTRQG